MGLRRRESQVGLVESTAWGSYGHANLLPVLRDEALAYLFGLPLSGDHP